MEPKGRELLDQMIEDPQGPAIFKVMLQPAGLAANPKRLQDDPRGKNFSLPTGHIQTANDLLKRMETVLNSKRRG